VLNVSTVLLYNPSMFFSLCAVVHHPAGESICSDDTWLWYQATILHQEHVQVAYFCSRFNENNDSFAHKRDVNRNHHVMHLTRVGNSNTKRVSLFGTYCMSAVKVDSKLKWCYFNFMLSNSNKTHRPRQILLHFTQTAGHVKLSETHPTLVNFNIFSWFPI